MSKVPVYIKRACRVKDALEDKSVLFLGPRRLGKTLYINEELKPDRIYNLLLSREFSRLSANPSLISEELSAQDKLVVVDEIQKLPSLMDEIHNLIETTSARFLLTGSSARKLRRSHTSLMGGRARVSYLLPFTWFELNSSGRFNFDAYLNYGGLPPVYLSADPVSELEDYIGVYLKEEILAEAIVRKIENFSRFLKVAALSNSELINFSQIARDAQVPQRTVVEYFNILADTMTGDMVEPFKSEKSRKTYSISKFYFFDLGVSNTLAGTGKINKNTFYYGKAFEHFIYLELKAYKIYSGKKESIQFWRDYNGNEVDFVIGGEIAIEAKSSENINSGHLKGLKIFSRNNKVKRRIIVSMDRTKRLVSGIEIIPVLNFLENLWGGKIW